MNFIKFGIFILASCLTLPALSSPILWGTVHDGQTLKLSGVAAFYKKTITETVRPFEYQANICKAYFSELSEREYLPLESVVPRLQLLIKDQVISLGGISGIKWKQQDQGYTFSAKIKVHLKKGEKAPLYLNLPPAVGAQVRAIGYLGNSCNVTIANLPTDWNFYSYEYLDQEQHEFNILIE